MNVTTPSFNRYRSVALSLAVALSACADRDPRYDLSMGTLRPVAAGSALVYVQPALARATVVDLTQETPAVRQVAVGDDPVVVSARVAHDEALVLSRGQRGSAGVAPAPASLTAVTAAGAARRWTLGSPFNALAQNSDGRYVMAYFSNSASAGRLLFNPNEVAIVDLDRAGVRGKPGHPHGAELRRSAQWGGVLSEDERRAESRGLSRWCCRTRTSP